MGTLGRLARRPDIIVLSPVLRGGEVGGVALHYFNSKFLRKM